MLKPRRLKSPATRASTPALFSTSTERMWWRGNAPCPPGNEVSCAGVTSRTRRSGCTTMSSLEEPAATIGNTFSKASVRKSTTTGRSSMEFAFSMAGPTSSGVSARMPTHPIASAHFT